MNLRTVGACLFLAILPLSTYSPSFWFDFINFDDPRYVSNNSVVAGGLTPAGIAYAWSTFEMGNWIPLTWMSYELDASLTGINASTFHVDNVVWHTANGCLLFLVLFRMTGAFGCSLAVATLFVVHPLHVESVAWVSERKDVLSTFWLLMTLLAYEWYVQKPGVQRYALVCAAFGLGLLAKSMLVTLPLLMLLLDYWPLRRFSVDHEQPQSYPARTSTQLIMEKLPLFAMSIAIGAVTVFAQRSNNSLKDLDYISVPWRMANAVRSMGWYLWKTVVPTDLCILYLHPGSSIALWQVAVSTIFLVAISVYVWSQFRRSPHLLTGWCWFVIALLPVVGLLQVGGQAQADRYTYVPHIGLFMMLVWEALLLGRQWGMNKYIGTAFVAAIAVSLLVLTEGQLATWRNDEVLWTHAIKLDPKNYVARNNYGAYLLEHGRVEEAREQYEAALEVRPNIFRAVLNLGEIAGEQGHWEKAEEYYLWSLRLEPGNEAAVQGLQTSRQKLPKRIVVADDLPSEEVKEQNRLGLMAARTGDMEAALRYFHNAIDFDPEFAAARNNAGLALKELKRPDEAEKQFQKAIEIDRENPDYHANLAALLEDRQRFDEAIKEYEIALRLKPQDIEIKLRLTRLKQRSGQHQK